MKVDIDMTRTTRIGNVAQVMVMNRNFYQHNDLGSHGIVDEGVDEGDNREPESGKFATGI